MTQLRFPLLVPTATALLLVLSPGGEMRAGGPEPVTARDTSGIIVASATAWDGDSQSVLCPNVTYRASINISSRDAAVREWTIGGKPVSGSASRSFVDFIPPASGEVELSVTHVDGSSPVETAVVLPVAKPPDATIAVPAELPAELVPLTVSVADAGPRATYRWVVTGAEITGGSGTPSVVLKPSGSENVMIVVWVRSACGLESVSSARVDILSSSASMQTARGSRPGARVARAARRFFQ